MGKDESRRPPESPAIEPELVDADKLRSRREMRDALLISKKNRK